MPTEKKPEERELEIGRLEPMKRERERDLGASKEREGKEER